MRKQDSVDLDPDVARQCSCLELGKSLNPPEPQFPLREAGTLVPALLDGWVHKQRWQARWSLLYY